MPTPITVKQTFSISDYVDRLSAQAISKQEMREKLGLTAPPADNPYTCVSPAGLEPLDPPMPGGGSGEWQPIRRFSMNDFFLGDRVPTRVVKEPRPKPKPTVLDFTDTYMAKVHDPDTLLDLAKRFLGGVKYDTLVGTGLSGTIAVTDLARKLDKKYLVVRKPNDGSHSYLPVEGKLGQRWVFVDDLVGTGTTFARVWDVIDTICEERSFETEFAGTFLYSDCTFYKPKDFHHCWLNRRSERYQGELEHPKGATWY